MLGLVCPVARSPSAHPYIVLHCPTPPPFFFNDSHAHTRAWGGALRRRWAELEKQKAKAEEAREQARRAEEEEKEEKKRKSKLCTFLETGETSVFGSCLAVSPAACCSVLFGADWCHV